MKTAPEFKFSQNNMQDFLACERRFWNRYIENLAWPALEAAPALENERFMQAGSDFHQLIHQYAVGIPQTILEDSLPENLIPQWWGNFISNPPFALTDNLHPEITLTTKLNNHILVAKYDLIIAHQDGTYTIFDWKTSRNHPQRDDLTQRMQTKVYPLLLSHGFNKFSPSGSIKPEKIQMVYWFANYPDAPEVFAYSAEQFESDKAEIIGIMDRISAQEGIEQFPLTLNTAQCNYCKYRSLCNRGTVAGDLAGLEDYLFELDEVDQDFDNIAPIEY